jgi:hypothetical protein
LEKKNGNSENIKEPQQRSIFCASGIPMILLLVHSIKICIESNEKRSLKLALRCLESVCGFNNNAHKAGLKVNALTAEIKIAMAKVTANCW